MGLISKLPGQQPPSTARGTAALWLRAQLSALPQTLPGFWGLALSISRSPAANLGIHLFSLACLGCEVFRAGAGSHCVLVPCPAQGGLIPVRTSRGHRNAINNNVRNTTITVKSVSPPCSQARLTLLGPDPRNQVPGIGLNWCCWPMVVFLAAWHGKAQNDRCE